MVGQGEGRSIFIKEAGLAAGPVMVRSTVCGPPEDRRLCMGACDKNLKKHLIFPTKETPFPTPCNPSPATPVCLFNSHDFLLNTVGLVLFIIEFHVLYFT